ncbi:serine/threonine-protein kinase [Streptomyces monticola]|uniref:Serine/threonine-protein kinase n=1 Tax=Streptomyces monticola TaxID=2666263 RepID=A0ABW2JUH2_9ACTN
MGELLPDDPPRIGPFVLLGRLGDGGMGTVFHARTASGRAVAVKTIRPELAAHLTFRERFRREVAAAQRVGGFWTAAVIDADPDAPVPWLATAYIDAPDLARVVTEHGPLAPGEVRRLGAGLAEALAAIHQHLVHRDLKPSNVLITGDGPRLIDFGIVKAFDAPLTLTIQGSTIGTPAFMSPEQATGAPVGPASDIFSLGAVLTFAATGHNPFGTGTGTAQALLYRVVHDAPDLTGCDPALRDLVAQCLAKQPEQRPTPAELLAALTHTPPAGDDPGADAAVMGSALAWWQRRTQTSSGPRADTEPQQTPEPAWSSTGDNPEATPSDRAAGPVEAIGFPVGPEVVRAREQARAAQEKARAPGPRLDEVVVGDVVEHAEFGVGTVVEVADMPGPRAKAVIAFGRRAKERRILLRYAPMRRITDMR